MNIPRQSIPNTSNNSWYLNSVQSTYSSTLFREFHKDKISQIPDYFQWHAVENIIDDFREFIEQNYGKNILSILEKTGQIQHTFEELKNRWFSFQDLENTQKINTIHSYLRSSETEQESMNTILLNLTTSRNNLSKDSQQLFPLENFFNDMEVSFSKNWDWVIENISYNQASKIRSVKDIELKWKEFIEHRTDNDNLKKIGFECVDVSSFDSTEKVVCLTMVDLIAKVTKSLPSWQKEEILWIFEEVFWSEWLNHKYVSAFTSWTSITDLSHKINIFIEKIKDRDDANMIIDKFNSIKIDVKNVISYAQQHNELSKDVLLQSHQTNKFSQLTQQVQNLCEKFFAIDLINNVQETKETLDDSISQFGKVFNVPWSLQWFFDQIPSCNTEEELRSKLEQKINSSIWLLWRNDTILSQKVIWILQNLQNKKWDISELSSQDQNILMKGNITLQLAWLKQKNTMDMLWYDFDAYADFISEIYDFNSKYARIKTKSWQYIDVNFNHKRFVWKPYQEVNLFNIQNWLEQIHVEFELDIKNNKLLKNLLRVATWGKYSPLFQFLEDKNHTQHMITESTKVEMTNKDWQKYIWYLSPSFLEETNQYDDDSIGWSDDDYKNTFVLYSRPADQYHNDRRIVEKLDSDGLSKPVFINPHNREDWEINVVEDNLTLNNNHINALVIWHTIAQQYDEQSWENISQTQDTNLQQRIQELQDTKITYDNDVDSVWEQTLEMEDKEAKIYESRNTLFPNNNKEQLRPTIWMRFAVQVENLVDSKVSINDPQLLSITIKSINSDGSLVLGFDSLTRPWSCSMKDVTLPVQNISKLKEIFQDVVYIWDSNQKVLPYKHMVSHLKDVMWSSKNKKKYNFWILELLDFKDNTFTKEGQPISFIVPSLHINRAMGWKENYYIEYSIKKRWDKYEISSSWYDAEFDGKKEKISYHCTTDLAGLILIFAGKQMSPYTAEEKKHITNWVDPVTVPAHSWQRVGFSMFFKVLKDWVFKKWIDWIKKKLFDDQEDDLKHLLFTESRWYRKLSDGPIGKLLGKFDLDIFDDLASETEEKSMDYNRQKIQWYQSHFAKYNMVYNASHGIFGMKYIFGVVKSANDRYPSLSVKDRHLVAAVLLHMLDKMKSWYAKDFDVFPKWTYVKLLMWDQAYQSYIEQYKQLESIAISGSGTIEKNKMNELATLEYDFIVTNTRWWSHQDEHRVRKQGNIPFYFQNIYGRWFANALWDVMWKSWDIDESKVKWHIDWWNFDWTYNDCKDHILQMRQHDAIEELIALRSLARNKQEADKVTVLAMAGILCGSFIHSPISSTIKAKLKSLFRSLSLPFPHWIEQPDAPQKIQSILQLATWNLWKDSFENFNYEVGGKTIPYLFDDFHPLKKSDKHKDAFVKKFITWMDTVWWQVIPFLHMDKENLDSENNMIRIRKSQESDITIFGKKVSSEQKSYVDDMMKELYHNRTRWNSVNIWDYNDNSEFSHPATMLDSFYTTINNYKNGQWDGNVADHASAVRSQLENNAPYWNTQNKPMMAHHVNEFFRVFSGIWWFAYDKSTIEQFYKNIRVAQTMPVGSRDRSRLLWFDMTSKLYDRKDVPQSVINTFQKYMKYFEDNLDQFDASLSSYHNQPDDGDKNFSYLFQDSLDYYIYVPAQEWNRRDAKERNRFNKQCNEDNCVCINNTMKDYNDRKLWLKWSAHNAMWKTVDDLWQELRWWFSSINQNNTPKTKIRVLNKDLDFSEISESPWKAVVWWRKDTIMKKIDPKYMTEEQKKQLEKENLFQSIMTDYYRDTA